MPTPTLRAHRTQTKRPRASVLTLSTEHADPLHLQLREQLRNKIDSEYADGEYFFTEQELIRELSVSRVTVRRALDDLRREGLLKRQAGKGTIVVKSANLDKVDVPNPPVASPVVFSNLDSRIHTIGIIVSGFASEYGSALMDSISENCDRRELHHQVYSTNLGARTDSALARITLPPEEVAFICFLAPYETLDVTNRLKLRGYRSIAVDGIPSGYTGPSVTTDSRSAIRIGLEHLWSLGHERITMLVNEPLRDETVTDKLEEFTLAMRERGLIQSARTVLCGTKHGSSSYEAAYRHMDEVWTYRQELRPTAIFTVSDPVPGLF